MTISEQPVIIHNREQEINSIDCSCDKRKFLEELHINKNILQSSFEKSQNEISALKRLQTEHSMYIKNLRSKLLDAECSSRRAQAKAEEIERKLTQTGHKRVPNRGLSRPLKQLFAYERAFKQQEVNYPVLHQTRESSSTSSPSTLSLASLEEILSQTDIYLRGIKNTK